MKKGSAIRLFGIVLIFFSLAAVTGCDSIKGFLQGKDDEVTKAYMAYRSAMLSGDIQGLKTHISKQKAHELDGPQAEQMLAIARAVYPANATVTGVNAQGDAATLTASAEMEGSARQGIIHMLKEDGTWKVYDEKWEMKIGMQPQSPPQETPDRDIKRPFEFEKLVGIWKGHEAGVTAGDWTFTLSSDYTVKIDSPSGPYFTGTAVVKWDLGIDGNSIRVLPGGGPFDMRVTDAQNVSAVGKMSLGSFKLMGDKLQICISEPGLMKRSSDFASSGGIRCFDLRKAQDLPAAPQPVAQPQTPTAQVADQGRTTGIEHEAADARDAFKKCIAAYKAGNMEETKKYISRTALSEMEQSGMMGMALGMMSGLNIDEFSPALDGDRMTFKKSEKQENMSSSMSIKMIKEDGQWKFGK